MDSSLRVIMQYPVIALIGLLPLAALAVPVDVSASSVAVAASSVGQGGMSGSYAKSFASSSSNIAADGQAYAGNPFLNGQFESSSSSSAGSISSSGLSTLAQNSAATESFGSGNAAASNGPVDISSSDAVDEVQNANSNAAADLSQSSEANSNSNGNTNAGCFGNQFDGANSNANSEDLESSAQVQGSGAVASAGKNQNQGSNENHGIENLNGRILHYAQSGPVIHVVTAGNANKVEVSGNNQGSGSSNAAGSVGNVGQVESQAVLGLGNSGSSVPGQKHQIVNAATSPLIAANANSLPWPLIGLTNGGVNSGAYPGALHVLANSGIGGLYQTAFTENSSASSNSSSSSSHSESHQSSSANSSNSFHNVGAVVL